MRFSGVQEDQDIMFFADSQTLFKIAMCIAKRFCHGFSGDRGRPLADARCGQSFLESARLRRADQLHPRRRGLSRKPGRSVLLLVAPARGVRTFGRSFQHPLHSFRQNSLALREPAQVCRKAGVSGKAVRLMGTVLEIASIIGVISAL